MGGRKRKRKDGGGAGTPTIENRKARHFFEILDTYEAGIALQGSEVKSLRQGRANLQDAYIKIKDGEAWLVGAHISPYEQAGAYGHTDPTRSRKLLLHRAELDRLAGMVNAEGMTLVPLKIYFNRKGLAKVLVGVARGRRKYDRRQELKKREVRREMERYAKGGKVRL